MKKEIEARIYDNKVLRTNENIVKKIKTKNQVMNKRTENLRKKAEMEEKKKREYLNELKTEKKIMKI